MQTLNHRIVQEAQKLIYLEIEGHRNTLAGGQLNELTRYKFVAGQIDGLKKADELMSEAISIIEKG